MQGTSQTAGCATVGAKVWSRVWDVVVKILLSILARPAPGGYGFFVRETVDEAPDYVAGMGPESQSPAPSRIMKLRQTHRGAAVPRGYRYFSGLEP